MCWGAAFLRQGLTRYVQRNFIKRWEASKIAPEDERAFFIMAFACTPEFGFLEHPHSPESLLPVR